MNIIEAADWAAIWSHAIPFAIIVGGYIGFAMFGGKEDASETIMNRIYNLEEE